MKTRAAPRIQRAVRLPGVARVTRGTCPSTTCWGPQPGGNGQIRGLRSLTPRSGNSHPRESRSQVDGSRDNFSLEVGCGTSILADGCRGPGARGASLKPRAVSCARQNAERLAFTIASGCEAGLFAAAARGPQHLQCVLDARGAEVAPRPLRADGAGGPPDASSPRSPTPELGAEVALILSEVTERLGLCEPRVEALFQGRPSTWSRSSGGGQLPPFQIKHRPPELGPSVGNGPAPRAPRAAPDVDRPKGGDPEPHRPGGASLGFRGWPNKS